MTPPPRRVIGAGPAGLVAAATLARAGELVEVWERADKVAGRFAGDFQGLEAWTDDRDLATRLTTLGFTPTLPYRAGEHDPADSHDADMDRP